MKKEFSAWIEDVIKKGQDANKELSSKEDPGRASSEFIGSLKGYRDEEWFEFFYR